MRRAALIVTLAGLALPAGRAGPGPAAAGQAGRVPERAGGRRSAPRRSSARCPRWPARSACGCASTSTRAFRRRRVYSPLKVAQARACGRSRRPARRQQRLRLHPARPGAAAPGSYKALVRFRWYDKAGKLLRSTTRSSPVCKQPDQRADLRAGTLDAVRGPLPDQATYQLEVRNDGHTAAGPFDVVLSRRRRRAAGGARADGPGARRRPRRSPSSPRAAPRARRCASRSTPRTRSRSQARPTTSSSAPARSR